MLIATLPLVPIEPCHWRLSNPGPTPPLRCPYNTMHCPYTTIPYSAIYCTHKTYSCTYNTMHCPYTTIPYSAIYCTHKTYSCAKHTADPLAIQPTAFPACLKPPTKPCSHQRLGVLSHFLFSFIPHLIKPKHVVS